MSEENKEVFCKDCRVKKWYTGYVLCCHAGDKYDFYGAETGPTCWAQNKNNDCVFFEPKSKSYRTTIKFLKKWIPYIFASALGWVIGDITIEVFFK